MGHVEFAGTSVTYELTGRGDVVLLPHARPFVRWYDPLADELAGWQVLRYVRPVRPGLTIDADAELCAALLDHLGLPAVHVAGHSYGGLVALALSRHTAVRSVALIEPATAGLVAPAVAAERFAPLLDVARTAGPAAAMDGFLTAVLGAGGADELDRLVPGALGDAMAHAPAFFDVELPAVVARHVRSDDVAAVRVPVLSVSGEASGARFAEAAAIVRAWFPTAIERTVPGATHLLVAQHAAAVAGHLVAFWRGIST